MVNLLVKKEFLSLLIVFGFSTGGITSQSFAEVYRWQDESGNTVYSDKNTDKKAQATQPKQPINYFIADKPTQTIQRQSTTLPILTAVEEENDGERDSSTPEKPLTESDCQEQYGLSCQRVKHWQKYAKEECGNDNRCDDPAYLDRKYRPRSIEEMRKTALQAAVRRNLQQERIANFLTRKYTNYCSNQAKTYCQNQRDRNCRKRMRSYCEDPRDLEDIFRQYDNLSPQEKQRIIAQAKQLARQNGTVPLNLDNIALNLIDLLLAQAGLGL